MRKFDLVWGIVVCSSLLVSTGCINVGSRFEIMPRPGVVTTPQTTKTGASVFCPNYPEGTTPSAVQGTTQGPASPLPKGPISPAKVTLGEPNY